MLFTVFLEIVSESNNYDFSKQNHHTLLYSPSLRLRLLFSKPRLTSERPASAFAPSPRLPGSGVTQREQVSESVTKGDSAAGGGGGGAASAAVSTRGP